jgi:outer membrane protein TolC
MKKVVGLACAAIALYANNINTSDSLSMRQAIEIVKSDNLELKAAKFDEQIAKQDVDVANGYNFGSLTFTQDVARSNDAGNVFGFKLTSRKATFGDFGFNQFFDSMNNGSAFTIPGQQALLTTQPHDLNYPGDQNFFQSKLKYEVPLFTGFKLSSYKNIAEAMKKMKTLDKDALINEKVYQVKKSYYDMALLEDAIKNLEIVLKNIDTLENMTQSMIQEGYAKNVDLLEVQAKKGNVERLISQMKLNEKLLYQYLSFLLNQDVKSIQTPSEDVAMPQMSDESIISANLDIKKASTGLAIRENMVRAQESVYYPTVGAFGEIATADDTFLGSANDHKAYTVGARLSWNLFNGGIDNASLQKSKIEQMKTKTQVELAKKGILLQAAKIKTEIASCDDDISLLKKELLLAEQIYKNYEARYKEQISSMSDVIIKQSEQIERIVKLEEARNKRNERIFALENLSNGEK